MYRFKLTGLVLGLLTLPLIAADRRALSITTDNLRSCHTAVSSQGYAFEGHIPARDSHQFLANPPADGIGLTVPAMPVGSPGMEVGDKFMPYRVLLMKKDGSTEVFASVESAAQQVQPLQQPEAQP